MHAISLCVGKLNNLPKFGIINAIECLVFVVAIGFKFEKWVDGRYT